MQEEIHQKDLQIFEMIVQSLQEKSYESLLELPKHEKLTPDGMSQYSTIEVTTQFHEIDQAINITAIQFLWLPKHQTAKLVDGLKTILLPLPNPNPDVTYSGLCKTEFFYALPDGSITDDIFTRNDVAEETIQEIADWFTTTGLTEEEERTLPKYVRYEYGDLLVDDDGMKAHDLKFLGKFLLNKQLIQLMHLDTKCNPTEIYIWHYYNEHYAYAYRNNSGILEYEIGNNCPIEQLNLIAS